MKRKISISFFSIAIAILFGLACILAIYPLWHVIVGSLISYPEYMQKVLMLWPNRITFENYHYVLGQGTVLQPLVVTIFITCVGTLLMFS